MSSPPERTMMFVYNPNLAARLVGLGNFRGKEWQLAAGTFAIGRDSTNDLVLDKEPGVSKTHCKITAENNQYVLMDNESRNGTLVNGMAVKRAVLQDKDEIRICNAMFRFEQLGAGDSPSPSAPTQARGTPLQPPQSEMTERVGKRGTPPPPVAPPPKQGSVWPFFVVGMLLFFGLAGGTAFYLGFIPPELLGQPSTPPPTEPKEIEKNPTPPTEVAAKDPEPENPQKQPEETPPPKANDPAPPVAMDPPKQAARDPEPTPPQPMETDKKPPEDRIKSDDGTFTGTVKIVAAAGAKVETTEVKHAINARVLSVAVKPGQKVHTGDTLLVYEDGGLRGRLETAREQYRSLREIAEAQDTDRARKALAEAKADVARLEAQAAGVKLVSPVDGTVESVATPAGKRAGKNTRAFVISGGASLGKGGKVTVVGIVPPTSMKSIPNGARATVLANDFAYEAIVTDSFSVPAGLKTTLEVQRNPAALSDGMAVKFRINK